MELLRGYKVDDFASYEEKQKELAKIQGVKGRYAGRVGDDNKVRPDIKLKGGGYFIPNEGGPDEINIKDIDND